MKSAKNLLIPFIIMLLLAIGVVVFFVIEKSQREKENESSGNSVDLLYVSPVDVAAVNVYHKDGGINVRVDKKTSNNGMYTFSYAGNDKGDESYSQDVMSEFVSVMTSFVSCTRVRDNGGLAQFGLDEPDYVVTVFKTDGSYSSISIGNLSPDPDFCYVCVQGSSAVYLVPSGKYKCASRVSKDFVDARIVSVTIQDIESVRFVRKKDSIDLYADCSYDEYSETYTFNITKPFAIKSSSYFDRLIERICDLEANEYENATSENLTKYGLSNPEYQITLKTKTGVSYVFDISSARNGFYYGRLGGNGNIFKISAEKLESLEIPVLMLINDYVFNETCDNVDSVECSGEGRKFVMKLDVAKDSAISDSESKVTLDGRNAKITNSAGRSFAAMLYEAVFGINIGGIEENAVIPGTAVPVMTITVFDRNHSSVVYSFYKRNDDSCYVYKDGTYTKFFVFNRELYNDGGLDTYDYGIWPAYEILTKAITDQISGIYDIPRT